jgi:hypothetical protein
MEPLRRSSRTKNVRVPVIELGHSYPDSAPANDFERAVAFLNQQSFPSIDFARVDDILLFAFFGTKRRHRSYRALKPSTAFAGDVIHATDDELLSLSHIFADTTAQSNLPFNFDDPALANRIFLAHPLLFSQSQRPIVRQ